MNLVRIIAPYGMGQMARNLTDAETGFLKPGMKLLLDRDTKYTAHFTQTLNESGIECLKLPPQSPNCNAHAERFVRTLKGQCLSRLFITGEGQLRKALKEFMEYYNHERPHQGLGGRIPQPCRELCSGKRTGKITGKKRLGGLLNVYFRAVNEAKPNNHKAKTAAFLTIFRNFISLCLARTTTTANVSKRSAAPCRRMGLFYI